MYGLPPDFDPDVFVGREIESVTFAANAIHISLGSDVGITATFSVRYQLSNDDIERVDLLPSASASQLMSLVGRSVLAAEASPAGDLTLRLRPEGHLMVFDESEQYESYTLLTLSGEIFV